MNPAEVRPARIADVPALAELSVQLGYPSTAAQCSDRLHRILGSNQHAVLVACAPGGDVVGWVHVFLALRVESEPFAELGGLVVAEGQRGRGIGRLLLDAAEAWAASRSMAKLRVRSRSSRVEAHGFYERSGFTRTKEQLVLDRLSDLKDGRR